jgi:RNA polymerase sigma-70 factor, ECF subfamily
MGGGPPGPHPRISPQREMTVTSLVHGQAHAVALHRPYLYRYAVSKLRRAEIADEVVQDTLIAALEGQATFRGESALRTWLTGILKHKIVDWQRREARDPLRGSTAHDFDMDGEHEGTADTLFDSAGGWVTPPSTWASPEQCLENDRFRELLDNCLAALPAATARAFYLREVEGLTTEEICDELGISESNCWVMLYRARMSLRRSLEERWFLKEEQRTSGTGTSPRRPRSRVAPEPTSPRRTPSRFREAEQGLERQGIRGQLQIEPA